MAVLSSYRRAKPKVFAQGDTPQSWRAFATDFGWIAMAGQDACLSAMTIGHPTRQAAGAALAKSCELATPEEAWWPDLVERIQRYLAGEVDDFRDVNVIVQGTTPLQRRVYAKCRAIGYGKTVSYGELARLSGAPGAARAIGSCMAQNRVPLVIPCHRVVGSQGSLGGYSGAGGIGLKRRLLALETCRDT